MAGVEIGRVEKITLANGKVTVAMKLHPDAVVKTDSQAVIKFAGLMGQNFVAINFGTPGAPKVKIRGFSLWGGVSIKRKARSPRS